MRTPLETSRLKSQIVYVENKHHAGGSNQMNAPKQSTRIKVDSGANFNGVDI
jgi:hypothetical protein